MYTNTTQYLRSLASDLVHGCRRTAADGTVIYTPDGTASYDGLWLRDFSYMVEYAGFAIPDQDIVNCIRYAVRHRRADGWMPDRVTTDGLAVYAAGIAAAPVGEANLDNTPFLIFTVDSLSRRMDPETFLPLFTEWEADLEQGLFLLPIDENGLVYNDVQKPHSPYGFTDTIGNMWRAGLYFPLFGTYLPVLPIYRFFQFPCMPFCGTGKEEMTLTHLSYFFQIRCDKGATVGISRHPTGSVRFVCHMSSLISMRTGVILH